MSTRLTPWSSGHQQTLRLILQGYSDEQIAAMLAEHGLERVTELQVSKLVAQTRTKYRTLAHELLDAIEIEHAPQASVAQEVARTLGFSVEVALMLVSQVVLTGRNNE